MEPFSSSKGFGFLGYKGLRYKNAMKGLSSPYNCCGFFFFFFLFAFLSLVSIFFVRMH
jgi:hypothetical protein